MKVEVTVQDVKPVPPPKTYHITMELSEKEVTVLRALISNSKMWHDKVGHSSEANYLRNELDAAGINSYSVDRYMGFL